MPRRGVGKESDDSALHEVRPKMACLSFLPGPAVVRAEDSPLKRHARPPRRRGQELGMESERSVTWNYWKGDLIPQRLETTRVWRNERTGERQQETVGIISAWIFYKGICEKRRTQRGGY